MPIGSADRIVALKDNAKFSLFRKMTRLDGWIRRRIWSHRYRRWRNAGWKRLPVTKLYGEYELVRLIDLIPSLASRRR
jgi:RNA-directed DNA polymerase